jgi:predicted CoA-binding protein
MGMEKITLVLGASPNPERYSNRAVRSLKNKNIPVIAIGKRESYIDDVRISKGLPDKLGQVHTVSLYLNATNQKEYYCFILSLNPKRVIFNPGTENDDFAELLMSEGIEVVSGCMLVMLSCGNF